MNLKDKLILVALSIIFALAFYVLAIYRKEPVSAGWILLCALSFTFWATGITAIT